MEKDKLYETLVQEGLTSDRQAAKVIIKQTFAQLSPKFFRTRTHMEICLVPTPLLKNRRCRRVKAAGIKVDTVHFLNAPDDKGEALPKPIHGIASLGSIVR